MDGTKVASYVVAHAGVGKLGVEHSIERRWSNSNFECNFIVLGLRQERWHLCPSTHLGCYSQRYCRASWANMVLEDGCLANSCASGAWRSPIFLFLISL